MVEWMAISPERGHRVDELFEVLAAAGVNARMANPGGKIALEPLGALLPGENRHLLEPLQRLVDPNGHRFTGSPRANQGGTDLNAVARLDRPGVCGVVLVRRPTRAVCGRSWPMDLQLAGKRALVTGGSRGIGKSIARALAEEGCDIAIAARDRATLDATRDELDAVTGRTVAAFVVDTGDDASVAAMVADTVAALGGIDILVNNAAAPGGQGAPPKLAEITDDNFNDELNVKVLGYIRCAREAAPHLAVSGTGRLINISGLAARSTGSTIGSIRNVSVAAMTANLAAELAPGGVTVTCVHPGLTRTEKSAGVIASAAAAQGVSPEEIDARMGARNVIGRWVDADEVAWLVACLASPRSACITGESIACGGGQRGVIHY